MNETLLIAAIFFPLIASPVFFLLEKTRFRSLGLVSCLISLISMVCITAIWFKINQKEMNTLVIPWVPQLGINLSFIIDGLSLFFGILVTGMGVLVNFYSNFYMDPKEKGLGRFYCCFTFFMGSMLGVVFSDNLMLLYMFWELTGLASFLLIGFHRDSQKAANNARLALMTTLFTGFFLFVGIILIGILDGTYLWSEIASRGINFSGNAFWDYPIIIFFLLGIFGKSAQLPFHFWLPRAMVAPTPVSAYLHAATMVKLGIFLTARMYPLFVTVDGWFGVVTTVCYATMLFGAVLSLLANDLKELLAYATISQLGFFLGFYGLGGPEGVQFDFFHIFNHALYKGSLFMLVGIIAKSTGIRDVRYLGGLWKWLPLTGVAFFLAAGAMAGVPGTTGFLSKELVLTDLLDREWGRGMAIILIVLISAMIFKVAFSIRLFYHIFVRAKGERSFEVVKPGFFVQLPPLILSLAAFIFGIWPQALNFLTGRFFVSSLHLKEPAELTFLHGWEYETFVSLGILIAGGALFYIAEKSNLWWRVHSMPDWGGLWDSFYIRLPSFAKSLTDVIHTKKVDVYLIILMIGFTSIIFGSLYSAGASAQAFSIDALRVVIAALIGLSGALTAIFQRMIAKLISLSISGFLVTLYFVLYVAPDLAMTQILVEVITVLILLMVFSIFKDEKPVSTGGGFAVFKLAVSLGVGCAAAWACWTFNSQPSNPELAAFFIENSPLLAKGNNVVNTILVDFRGLDTLGETAVLVICALGVWGMLYTERDAKKTVKLIPSVILRSMIPFIFVLINVFSLYLLIRGHDLPGGGFISGLGSGISVVLLSMIYQTEQIISISRLNIKRTSALGLLLMTAVSLYPLLFERSLLSHYILNFNTPLIFDFGVYFAVLGVTVKIFFSMRNKLLGEEADAA